MSLSGAATHLVVGLLAASAQVLEVPALRRSALITLAVRSHLVERLWFSHLRVIPRLHASAVYMLP